MRPSLEEAGKGRQSLHPMFPCSLIIAPQWNIWMTLKIPCSKRRGPIAFLLFLNTSPDISFYTVQNLKLFIWCLCLQTLNDGNVNKYILRGPGWFVLGVKAFCCHSVKLSWQCIHQLKVLVCFSIVSYCKPWLFSPLGQFSILARTRPLTGWVSAL